jgi:hypothetical protein
MRAGLRRLLRHSARLGVKAARAGQWREVMVQKAAELTCQPSAKDMIAPGFATSKHRRSAPRHDFTCVYQQSAKQRSVAPRASTLSPCSPEAR